MPAGPQEREDQRSSDGAKTCLKPRKRVASPAWFLSDWSSQQCRVVVDGGRDQNAPFEGVGIREYQSREDDVCQNDDSAADNGCDERPGSRDVEAKGTIASSCETVSDKRRSRGAKTGDDDELDGRVPQDDRREHKPRDPVCEADEKRIR